MSRSLAERLEAMARAIRADAEERATTLEAMVSELSRDDQLVNVDVAASELGITTRQLKDDLKRRKVVTEKIGNSVFVCRSQLTKKVEVKAKSIVLVKSDGREDERAASEQAISKIKRSA